MFEQDIAAGQGCALFDPHGDLVSEVRELVRSKHREDVIDLDVPNPELRWHFNPFSDVLPGNQALAAASLVEAFKKIWVADWGPRLEHLLRNVVFTLLETPGASLADIPPLLTDKTFRSDLIANLQNTIVREFWTEEFDRYSQPFRAVVTAPLQNKIGALLTDPLLRRILTEEGPSIDLREIMNTSKILLVNLDKGRIGEGPATILGSFLVSHIALAGLSRSAQPEIKRRDFLVYLDEFQTFTTLSLVTMLAELRKRSVSMTFANQFLAQIDPAIRDAVFGNVGTLISFRVGAADASYLSRELAPVFSAEDLISLPRYHVYIRLLIDGEASRPFSATTLASVDEIPGETTRSAA